MEFIVLDRLSIERATLVRSAYVVISIHDPDKPPARVRRQAGLRDVFALAFDDAEPSAAMELPPHITLMSEAQARQIWEFVRKWQGQVGAVIVHCEQGMSRSPAVAAALCRAYGGDESCYFRNYMPNAFVFWRMNSCRPLDPAA